MWMVAQRAILTKDNMLSRNWHGDQGCYFFGSAETVDHLLFWCLVAKVVWGIIDVCFHQKDKPSSYEQFLPWIRRALPDRGGGGLMSGLAAVCWAIWTTWNRVCFDKIQIKNSYELIFSACLSMWSLYVLLGKAACN
jgi:hypothetical protein